jgi:Cu-processing system permease protein
LSILVIARSTFREAVRDKVFSLVGVFGLVLLLSTVVMSPLTIGAQTKIVADIGLGAMTAFSLIVILLVGSGMVHKEIDKRTITTILSKPISRLEFLIGKSLGLLWTIAVMMGAMTALFLVAVLLTRTPFRSAFLVSILLSMAEMVVVTSVAMFFSSFTGSLLTSLFTLGVFIAGHTLRDLETFAGATGNGGVERGALVLRRLLPDLELFNIRNAAVHGLPVEALHVLWSLLYGALYSASLLGLAAILFRRREFR